MPPAFSRPPLKVAKTHVTRLLLKKNNVVGGVKNKRLHLIGKKIKGAPIWAQNKQSVGVGGKNKHKKRHHHFGCSFHTNSIEKYLFSCLKITPF